MPEKIKDTDLPDWDAYIGSGKYGAENRKRSLQKGKLEKDGRWIVRGYYSDIELIPRDEKDHPLYPTHDHIDCDADNENMAIEAAIINRLKTNLPEEWFWKVIAHLFAVGVRKNKYDLRPSTSVAKYSELKDFDLERFTMKEEEWNVLAEALIKNRNPRSDFIQRLKYAIGSYSGGELSITENNLTKAIADVIGEKNTTKAMALMKLIQGWTTERSRQGLWELIEMKREEIGQLVGVKDGPTPSC